MNKNQRIVIISISTVLCLILDYIKTLLPFLNMPFGGSINISLIPIVIVSLVYGYKEGTAVGFFWWLISSLLGLNVWFVSIWQYLFDYVLPSIIPGLVSVFCLKTKSNTINIIFGITITMIVRTIVLVISGALFWTNGLASGSNAAWVASLTYNVPYNLLTCLLLCVVVPVVIKRLPNNVLR